MQGDAASKPGPGEYKRELPWEAPGGVIGTSGRTLEDSVKEWMS